MRIVIIVQYDGTNFCGWQIQKNGRSVQETIEKAIYDKLNVKVRVTGSGRTDSGVHALGQVAHFDTDLKIPSNKFAAVINSALPEDVKIIKSYEANENFHSRFSAKRKTYIYNVYESDVELPLKKRFSVLIPKGLDIEKIKKAVKLIVGEHNFKCFSSVGTSVKTTIRTIYSLNIIKNENNISFEICGNGFLYNMVRIIVGTLIGIGQGKIEIEAISNAFILGDRKLLGKTMPPQGLILKSVEYFEN